MSGPDGTTTYTYDATSQLTAADHDYQTDESYSYNATGGRSDTDYNTGTNNRLLSDGTHSYSYDDNGNRTRKTTIATRDYVSYEWDHRNRLIAVEFRTSTDTLTKKVEFDYDLFDRLIAKGVDDDGDGTFDRGQSFVYDGLNIVLVFDDAGSLENRFLHGPAVDQFFADEDALGEVLWGLSDNLGTVRDVVEYDAGTDVTSVVNHIQYDSFGNATSESNTSASPLLKFTGRYFDEDVDLQWNWQRWYDAGTGLWLSEDLIGFGAGDTNLYRYVSNSSTNYVDPTGLTTDVPFGAPPLNPVDCPEVYEMMARMNGTTAPPSYSDQGYTNDFYGFIGEWVIRPILGDERLAQPGDTVDDIYLAAQLTTEITSYVDPTPMSDLLNGSLRLMDGQDGAANDQQSRVLVTRH